MEEDIRWEQRFSNFQKALAKLTDAIELMKQDLDSSTTFLDILKEGLIQRFEYTHELAWNVMKDFAEYQGNSEIRGSRDATRNAFKINLIENGDVWMQMIKSRNETSHTYNEETAEDIYQKIISEYFDAFISFDAKMKSIQKKD
ncbi:MAG: nucleotidyltransferase substrate binding protein [Flavobacteriia bacterium]|nr:nucleotidyltransferase substrate binding protein [Flavobacteriia bacterium]